jgi:hypothetical protein
MCRAADELKRVAQSPPGDPPYSFGTGYDRRAEIANAGGRQEPPADSRSERCATVPTPRLASRPNRVHISAYVPTALARDFTIAAQIAGGTRSEALRQAMSAFVDVIASRASDGAESDRRPSRPRQESASGR